MFADCRDIRPLKFDFYIPSANLLIEYDGEQHFRRGKMGKHYVSATELREVQRRDSIKTDYAKRRGIRLLRIAYTDFSRIDDILTSHLTNRHCVLCCEYD
jgi:very-short-patch-repair endonuclease